MRNRIFQWIWYKVGMRLIPVRPGTGPERGHYRIIAQYILARCFGRVKLVILGDSEIATFASYEIMKEWDMITVNFGEGGTLPSDWIKYLKGTGAWIYKKILGIPKVVSIGGNCSLKDRMGELSDSIITLRVMLPRSAILLVPPVYCSWLSKISRGAKTREQFSGEMADIRLFQRLAWKPYVIDTYTPFLNAITGESKTLILGDPVHFSKFADKLTLEFVDGIL